MRFTEGEKVLAQQGDEISFVELQNLKKGDIIFKVTNESIAGIEVESLKVVDQARTVYKFNVSPVDTLIAGGIVVHNSKV